MSWRPRWNRLTIIRVDDPFPLSYGITVRRIGLRDSGFKSRYPLMKKPFKWREIVEEIVNVSKQYRSHWYLDEHRRIRCRGDFGETCPIGAYLVTKQIGSEHAPFDELANLSLDCAVEVFGNKNIRFIHDAADCVNLFNEQTSVCRSLLMNLIRE